MRSHRWQYSLALGVLVLGAGLYKPQPDSRPNILLIVADDLGYADLGVYGGEIRTPNIDALAAEGMLFTQFHTSPLCAPTRAMLLSGNNNHVAGVGRMHASGPIQVHVPGYETHLSDRIAPLPRLLQDAGYHTYTAGKWHLGDEKEHSPTAAGFERSFNLMHGGGNHFRSGGVTEEGSLYREDGEVVPWPEGAYSTDLYTDRLIEFIEAGKGDGRPFFAFAAYTSPHWPLQVPDEDLNLYAGQYDDGYDRLREVRFESLKRARIIPAGSALPPRNEAIKSWEQLTPEQRRVESRKMELYAAMVENLDRHVGKLIAYLKSNGLYENTTIVFMSDNGAAGEDFFHFGDFSAYLQSQYDNSYENMGRATSWVSYGPQWAEAGAPPFSRYKGYTREGGIAAPMIISGAGTASRGAISRAYVTVMDLAPTLLQLAGAKYPADSSIRPMLGETMIPLLRGAAAEVHDSTYVTTLYHGGHAFVRQGRWKLVNLEAPFDESGFELFDIEADPGETTNLAVAEPERFRDMLRLWREQRRKLGIVLPSDL
jgi:arylsulfatase A-like enzyme